ncbi:SRPBCC family protein [Aquabacterium humicola]|uniref:SRPBCC family protein n=1 Tax=Aquabacterium humicola TaxID=3237377 RepID=UPI002543966B|nr:SRPBCC family protein [Rubrivivax pictus]
MTITTAAEAPRFDVEPFRARYRAAISRHYSVWLHAGFVLAWGLATVAFFWSGVAGVKPLEWLAVPAALLFCNWGEYMIHRRLGHRKTAVGALFYKRHTGDHHSFFAEGRMHWEGGRDFRVILFPPWLIVVFTLALALPVWWLLQRWNANVAGLAAGTIIGGYLLYEVLHASEHLPDGHVLAGLPWIRQMRRLHQLHHRRSLMAERNLNIVFPLMDWLLGTLHWEPYPDESPRAAGATTMVHEVEIHGTPAEVLAYAGTPAHWPEWHPSSLRIDGAPGPLHAGARFEEDIHAGGRSGHLVWQVLAHAAGAHWQAEAHGSHRLWLQVTYLVDALPGGRTRFERRLVYRLPGFWMGLYNRLVGRRRVERESALSLAQLKQRFEARSRGQRC